MIKEWNDLKFFGSGEEQVIQERLAGRTFCPGKKNLYKALDETKFEDCKVAFLGQDPYPDLINATGLAFSVPSGRAHPPTLKNILEEYQRDLHYPGPISGDLTKWANQGVLLWNVIPSCGVGKSLSHDWEEWKYLTNEILDNLEEKDVVIVAFGSIAQRYVLHRRNVILVSHPSPRASLKAKHPFIGSRIFTRVNDGLCRLGKEPIAWRL